jgi:hypothetical protein
MLPQGGAEVSVLLGRMDSAAEGNGNVLVGEAPVPQQLLIANTD